ncbi:hypothetical protein [Vibrio phage vB_VpP_DE18]|uniref:Uncharacterized protein n=1 Tax=Vibrio phage vB_VpP_DE18 TaxID=2836122 RepID=A0A8F3C8C0_9CAUD|nr:hypothetical protein [Vibrio phage vB_VpP_DE18]
MGKACESHWPPSGKRVKPCTRKMLYSGEGVLPHPRARFPRGGACVCAGVRALACACMGYPARARACVLLSVGKQGKATGKPCDCVGGAAVLCACLFCMHGLSSACACVRVAIRGKAGESDWKALRLRGRRGCALRLPFFVVLSAHALHLSAHGYLMAIHLLSYGIFDALCYPSAIHLLTLAIVLLSLCYPIDLRFVALASLRSVATIGNVS